MWINLWITLVVPVDNLWITLVQQLKFYPQDTHRISPTCGQPVDNLWITLGVVENLWITWAGGGARRIRTIAVAT